MRTKRLKGGVLWQKWRDIPDYEGYYRCSSLGKIKSLERIVIRKDGYNRPVNERILHHGSSKKGYLSVVLCVNGVSKTRPVHQLVAVTFLGHIPKGQEIIPDHIDGNKAKNYASNLRIVTLRENNSTCFRKNRDSFTSKYTGVSWYKSRNKWASSICVKSKDIRLGYFITEEEASIAYQNALSKLNQLNINQNEITEDYFTYIKHSIRNTASARSSILSGQ